MPFVGLERLDNGVDVVSPRRPVDQLNVFGRNSVELQDIIVHLHQSAVYGRPHTERGIAEHAHLSLRAISVAQPDGVVNNAFKIRVSRRLAVSGKGQSRVGRRLDGRRWALKPHSQ